MYGDIGKELKVISGIILIGGLIVSIIYGAVLIADGEGVGLAYILIGPVVSTIVAGPIYGFGELIERTVSIDKKLSTLLLQGENSKSVHKNAQTK